MNLPIDVILGTNPPKFRWRQVVSAPTGKHVVEHEGLLPPAVEGAVADLVGIAKQLAGEKMVLEGSIRMAVDRLGGTVEGKPTHEGNFLQRVDELVAMETRINPLTEDSEAPPKTPVDSGVYRSGKDGPIVVPKKGKG